MAKKVLKLCSRGGCRPAVRMAAPDIDHLAASLLRVFVFFVEREDDDEEEEE
jgi:hypothetical protein